MSAIQQVDRATFGVGRLFITPPGALGPLKLGILNDVSVDIKSENKATYGEGAFPAIVSDGHKSIDITTKHYQLNLTDIANDFGANVDTPGASIDAVAFDEPGTVPSASPYHATLANGATFAAGTLQLTVYVANGSGGFYPVTYKIVAAGSEAAGSAASVSTAGVITFAAGDAGLAFVANYAYGATTGSSLLLTNNYQNSSPTYTMRLAKRDRSPIDGSTGILLLDFFAVRAGGLKIPFKEGDQNGFDKTYMAYADPLGNVARLTFINV